MTFFILAFFALSQVFYAQNINAEYDSVLAKSLGAEDYGMKNYVLVILKTGPGKVTDKGVLDSLFRGHMASISKLADEEKLIVAGPMGKNPNNYRGIFILNTNDFEEANKMLSSDPTITNKVFEVELYNWYGAAALGGYLPVHKKISKQNP